MCSSIALHGLVQLYLVLAEVEGTLNCARRADDARPIKGPGLDPALEVSLLHQLVGL